MQEWVRIYPPESRYRWVRICRITWRVVGKPVVREVDWEEPMVAETVEPTHPHAFRICVAVEVEVVPMYRRLGALLRHQPVEAAPVKHKTPCRPVKRAVDLVDVRKEQMVW